MNFPKDEPRDKPELGKAAAPKPQPVASLDESLERLRRVYRRLQERDRPTGQKG